MLPLASAAVLAGVVSLIGGLSLRPSTGRIRGAS
jgi:hypothetical protein